MRKKKLGAFKTKRSRRLTIIRFVKFLEQNNIFLHDPKQLKGKHLEKFAHHLSNLKVTINTKQNYMSDVRFIYRAIGKPSIAGNSIYSNENLGFGGRKREGTNRPLTEEELQALVALAKSNGQPAFGVALTLQMLLGLRLQEVLYGKSDQLRRWIKDIKSNGRIFVENGTKGGRPRCLLVKNIPRTLAVLKEALQISNNQNGFLIVSKKIRQPTLIQAYRMYSRFWLKYKVRTHSARYAFAIESFRYYFDNGNFSEIYALGRTALELGHGFCRYRLVKMVYCSSLYVNGNLSIEKVAEKSLTKSANRETIMEANNQEIGWTGSYQLSQKFINFASCIV
jgi:hypothetical protein